MCGTEIQPKTFEPSSSDAKTSDPTTLAAQVHTSGSSPLTVKSGEQSEVAHYLWRHPESTPRQLRRHLERKRRRQRTCSIINATYAICEGRILDPESRALAYPVYRIRKNCCLVPASSSDYRILQSYKANTNARRTSISFDKSALIPGALAPTPCITVTMPKIGHEVATGIAPLIFRDLGMAHLSYHGKELKVVQSRAAERILVRKDNSREGIEPDDSLSLSKAEFPFLVLEVRDTETRKHLKEKVRSWIRYSKSMVKIVCTLEVEPLPGGSYQILASVLKGYRRHEPTPGRPHRFVQKKLWALRRIDISSAESQATFTIDRSQMRSKNALRSPTGDNSVTISLRDWHPTALQAVEEKVALKQREKKEKANPSQFDEDQSSASSSSASSSGEKDDDTDDEYSDYSEDGEDDDYDDYDSDDDSEPGEA